MEAQRIIAVIKNIIAKYIYKRGAGERNFLLGRSAGLLSELSTETQSGTLCVGLNNSLSSCCVSVAGAVWGGQAHSVNICM